jgi:hypothetical protein
MSKVEERVFKLYERITELEAEVKAREAYNVHIDNDRAKLQALVRDAYDEGLYDGQQFNKWEDSDTKAALEPVSSTVTGKLHR